MSVRMFAVKYIIHRVSHDSHFCSSTDSGKCIHTKAFRHFLRMFVVKYIIHRVSHDFHFCCSTDFLRISKPYSPHSFLSPIILKNNITFKLVLLLNSNHIYRALVNTSQMVIISGWCFCSIDHIFNSSSLFIKLSALLWIHNRDLILLIFVVGSRVIFLGLVDQ